MSNYIRTHQPGAQLFFTVRLANRNGDLLVREIERLRHATRITHTRYPFEINEIVVLPAVIHTIWTLPPADSDFSTRWRMLKSQFSRGLPTPAHRDPVTIRRGEKGIWQRRFWEHHLKDADDYEAHRQMILKAPVQAGLVRRPQDWAYTSVHRAIRRGEYDPQTPVGFSYAPNQTKAHNPTTPMRGKPRLTRHPLPNETSAVTGSKSL
ncbi:transposase [Ascidiaceihabitans sp.]|uniref:REP-associated tyrosine transposase n=1 Tax=Ascidiaceihabitans sp. TaxID=1872644 RepID=UPI003299906C